MSNGHLNSNIISYFIVCIFYISKHDRDRVTLLRLRAFVICAHNYLTRDNLIFVHAIFLPRATLCAFISIACVRKILTVYSIMWGMWKLLFFKIVLNLICIKNTWIARHKIFFKILNKINNIVNEKFKKLSYTVRLGCT